VGRPWANQLTEMASKNIDALRAAATDFCSNGEWSFVGVADSHTGTVLQRKARTSGLFFLVAGTGFEPVTFGL
jgi:hypothetical protein